MVFYRVANVSTARLLRSSPSDTSTPPSLPPSLLPPSFYPPLQEKHKAIGTVWLGFCVRGIVAYDVHKEVKTPIHHCSWRKIQNLSFAVSSHNSNVTME